MTITSIKHSAWLWGEQPPSRSQDAPHHVRAIGELWPIVEAIKARRILDAGSGEPPSALADMVRERGLSVVTLDAQSEADVRADMHDLPFDSGDFDLIVARHSLEHCAAPVLALREMRRVAERALVVLPDDCDKFLWWRGHFAIFPRRVWEHLFRLAGWRVAYFAEGDFSQEGACDRDVEWRYLLERERAWLPVYEQNGHYIGHYTPPVRQGWQ